MRGSGRGVPGNRHSYRVCVKGGGMALTKCKDCGNEVSKKATSCPKCGAPLKKQKKKTSSFTWLVIILIGSAWLYSTIKSSGTRSTSTVQPSTNTTKSKPVTKPKVTQAAKNKFKKWALENTAVTYLEYPEGSDWQLWVRLKPEKYTTKANVEQIALNIARYYKLQTKFNSLVIVTVWDPNRSEIIVKGRL